MSRTINNIFIHCTGTPPTTTTESIQRVWREERGWKSPGYHKIIKANGEVVTLAGDDKITNGVAGYNSSSLHVSYVGGLGGHDTRTPAQKRALIKVLNQWKQMYPKAVILGHRDVLQRGNPGWKDCPSFEVREWLECIGL